jgi:hypothetical protein
VNNKTMSNSNVNKSKRRFLRNSISIGTMVGFSQLVLTGPLLAMSSKENPTGKLAPFTFDFAKCGYANNENIPLVKAVTLVEQMVEPIDGDATALIQQAIDHVSSLPLNQDGFRGAVLLAKGTFHLQGQLKISTSGVVLRGSGAVGNNADGTRLIASGNDRRTLIEIKGNNDKRVEKKYTVQAPFTKAGAQTLTLDSVEGLNVGDQDMFLHHDLYFSESIVRINSISASEIKKQIPRLQSLAAMETAPDFYNAYWEKVELKPSPWTKIQKLLKGSIRNQQELVKRINDNGRVKWDYLVLQSWRDVVGDDDKGYAEYAQKWAKMAEKEGIKLILYITVPHAQNAAAVNAPVAVEQTEMEMRTIQKLASRIQPHAIVPVALGIKNIQQNGTDLKFRYVNDYHPNQYSAFLTSNMFYASFFKESTEGFNYNTVVETNPKSRGKGKDPDGGNAKVVFDEKTKTLLQQAAFDAVMEYNSKYGK